MSIDDEAIRALLGREVERAGSASRWAADNGFSAQFVRDVLHQRRRPSDRLGEALGYERVCFWRRPRPLLASHVPGGQTARLPGQAA